MRPKVSLPSSIRLYDRCTTRCLCRRGFFCFKGIRHRLLESHLPSSLPRLLEGLLAQPSTYGGHCALIHRAVGLVVHVNGHSNRLVQSFGRADEVPTAL